MKCTVLPADTHGAKAKVQNHKVITEAGDRSHSPGLCNSITVCTASVTGQQ